MSQARLRIVHTNYLRIHPITKEEPTKCDICNPRMIVKLISVDCPKYKNERRQENTQNDFKQALNIIKIVKALLKLKKNINLMQLI